MASRVHRRFRLIAAAGVGVLVSCVVAGWPAAAGAACPPVAIVEGAAEIVAPVGEVSTASDGSVWYGGGAAACAHIGSICLGARARIARDAGTGSGVLAGSLSRTRIDGAVTASLPLSSGAFTFAPALGVGL